MTQQQGIVKGDALQKMGSAGFIIAAVLYIVGVTWATTVGLSDPVATQARFSNQLGILDTVSLMLTFGGLALLMGGAPPANKEAAHNLLNTPFPPGLGFGRGLFSLEILVNWLAFAFLGTGMTRSGVYSRWLGWVGLILGIIGVLAGIVMTYIGRKAIFTPFTAQAFATLLWFLMCGIWVARKAW